MKLEDKLMEDVDARKRIDIERALLIFSGLQTEEEVATYKTRLDIIDAGFQVYVEANDVPENKLRVAKALHDYLWKDNKERYNSNSFLTDVIDAQLSLENKPVGNCVGLTALYTVLGLRHGLDLSVLINPRHILSRLKLGEKGVSINNVTPKNFGNVRKNPFGPFREHGLYGLLAVTLGNRGNKKNVSRDYPGALIDYLIASQLDDTIPGNFYNLGVLEAKMGHPKAAIKDYDKAIELDDLFVCAYGNRGRGKFELNDYEGALEDLEGAIALEPTNTTILKNLIKTKVKLGDIEGAIEDYDWLSSLDPDADSSGKLKKLLGDGALSDYDKAVEVKST